MMSTEAAHTRVSGVEIQRTALTHARRHVVHRTRETHALARALEAISDVKIGEKIPRRSVDLVSFARHIPHTRHGPSFTPHVVEGNSNRPSIVLELKQHLPVYPREHRLTAVFTDVRVAADGVDYAQKHGTPDPIHAEAAVACQFRLRGKLCELPSHFAARLQGCSEFFESETGKSLIGKEFLLLGRQGLLLFQAFTNFRGSIEGRSARIMHPAAGNSFPHSGNVILLCGNGSAFSGIVNCRSELAIFAEGMSAQCAGLAIHARGTVIVKVDTSIPIVCPAAPTPAPDLSRLHP